MMIAPSKYDQPNTLRVGQVTHQPAYVRTASNKSKFLSPFKTTLSTNCCIKAFAEDPGLCFLKGDYVAMESAANFLNLDPAGVIS